jgi:hypothetical protein
MKVMKSVSRWFTLVSAVAVGIVAAGCGSKSMSGPSEVVTGARTEEQGARASAKAADAVFEAELVGFVKSVSAPSLTVAGRTVVTSKATEITRNKVKVPFGSIKVGEHVKVQGVVRADGKLQAREIKVAYKGTTPNTIPGDRPSDDHGGNGSDDPPNHDAGDDNGGNGGGNGSDDPANHNTGDDNGNHGAGHN